MAKKGIKLQRKKSKMSITLQTLTATTESPHFLLGHYWFDVMKYFTIEQKRSKRWQIAPIITVEHSSRLFEHDSNCFTYVAHKNSSSGSTGKELLKQLKSKSLELYHIHVIRCNGAVVNTEVQKGVIQNLETNLQRPLQWLVCQLHTNNCFCVSFFFTLTEPQKYFNIFF